MLDDRKIMGDKHIRESQPVLQILHEIQNLGLDRDVQSRYGLVADNKLGTQGESPGNPDPLPSAAVQFVGIGVYQPFGQSHQIH